MFDGRAWAFLAVFLLFLAQNFLEYLLPGQAPSLVLIGVIYFSLRGGPRFGTVLGFFAGALAELYGQGAFGFYLAEWAVVGAVSGLVSSQIFQDSLPAEIFLPGLAAYFSNFAELAYRRLGAGGPFPWDGFVQAFRPGVIAVTALASLVLFSWLKKFPKASPWHR